MVTALIILLLVHGQANDNPGDSIPDAIDLPALCREFAGTGAVTSIAIDSSTHLTTLAVVDDAGKLHLIRGAKGRWSRRTTDIQSRKPPRLVLCDLNDDGTLELIIASKQLQIYSTENRLTLIWTSHEIFDDEPAPRLEVLDFNRDGRKEIVALNYKERKTAPEQSSVYVFAQDKPGSLSFGPATTVTLEDEHGYHSTSGLAVADFAGTGVPQIAVGNDNGFLWMLAFKDGDLEVVSEWKVPSGGAIGWGLAAGDLDDREGSELMVGTNGGDLFVFGFDQEHKPSLHSSAKTGRLAYGVTAGDFDGDGRQEFGLTRGHAGYAGMTRRDVVAEVWKLNGGRLGRVWRAETIDRPRPMVHDIDGDGRDEMIVYSQKDGEVTVIKPTW